MRDLRDLSCVATAPRGVARAGGAASSRDPPLPQTSGWAPLLDYCTSRLSRLMCSKAYISAAVAAWRRHGRGRKGVAFAVDIAHSQALAAAFNVSSTFLRVICGEMRVKDHVIILYRKPASQRNTWTEQQTRPSEGVRW